MIAIRSRLQEKVKLTQIIMESVIIVLAALVFFPLGKNEQRFNQNCLLNSNIFVTRHTNESVSLDLVQTVFGDPDECAYTTFFNVMAALHGLIWIWFFFHIDSLRSHNGSAVNLLMPALGTHIVLLICAITCGIKITVGFNTMCGNLQRNNKPFDYSPTCKDYELLPWTENRSDFYTFFYMALVSSWFLVVVIIISILITFVHLYWDFTLTAGSKETDALGRHPAETSGYADNGVGVVNKGALQASDEECLNQDDSDRDSDDDGDQHSRESHPEEVTVDVHGMHPDSQPAVARLRNREVAVGNDS